MKNIVVIAPHPDDETLGCGGIISKYLRENNKVYWVVVSKPKKNLKNHKTYINEIVKINNHYKFTKLFKLNFHATQLDKISKSKIIKKLKEVFTKISPNYVFLPFEHDAHSDHKIVNEASISALKWFRQKSIEKILIYEVLSETNFNFKDQKDQYFRPNLYIDISKDFKSKCEAAKIYKSEFSKHPFPRNLEVIKSLALIRGSEAGFKFSEAFKLIYQRENS